ncbi:FAD binding domain-containing protein [Leptodontidium sp. MPI-SDFR-AT-0119]|nr:FAD binding domain-containing protein [Leptodontidium sp. MPI-SDFR-AT-0119]
MTMGDASDIKKVLIAGAGPIFEKSYQLQTGPRAAGHYGPDLEVMKRAGIYEIFAEAAHFQDGLVFRAPPVDDGKGGKTFGWDIATIREPQLTLPQSTIVPLLVMEIAKTGLAKIQFGKEVVGIKQDENLVILSTKGSKTGEVEQVKGEYLAGTDGGRSVVRSLLGIGFPGHTWKERVIATNVTLTNEALAPTGSHLVVHPVEWDSKDTRPDEELMTDENIIASYDHLMAGSRPIQCKIEARAVYHIHQRLASTLRRGRVLLAGDAAHLCNPLGGMGLTSGILDSEALSDALIMVINEDCSDQVLTLYSDLRRQVFGLFVDPMSTQNIYLIQNNADDLERDDGFIRRLNRPGTQAMDMMRKLYEEQWRTNIRSKFAQMGAPH